MSARASAPAPTTLPALPALVVGRVHHTRHRPVRHSFTHRHYQWLVDLDALPTLPRALRPFSRIRPEDHLGGAATVAELRANVLRCLERGGLPAGEVRRVLLFAQARVLGHVFDPMSVFWCLDADDRIVGAVIEVHNTYGERHAYPVRLDASGAATVVKDFYVSPFNAAGEGEYAVRLRLSERRVAASVRLDVAGEPLLLATVAGATQPATAATLVRALVRTPLVTQRVTALIRVHGIWLWLRRLPVRPRPSRVQESVA